MLGATSNTYYDKIFEKQFFDMQRHEDLPLTDFIDELCKNFVRHQRYADGQYPGCEIRT